MVKFLLGIAIVAFSSYCGFVLTKKYRKRKLFFMQLKEFNERFLSEISYYRRPIGEFASKYVYQGEFRVFLENFFTELDEISQSTEAAVTFEMCDFLTDEEKSVVGDYFKMLGKGDSASQKVYFSAAKEKLGKLQASAETDCKKYGDLYIKLGFLLGLLILILII